MRSAAADLRAERLICWLLLGFLLCSCVTARQQTHSTVSEHEHPRIFQTNNPIK